MKVVKFGGSSLASAEQLKKVFNIVKSDSSRRVVVVSAPGKRHATDEKVTDLLIELAKRSLNNQVYDDLVDKIVERYQQIAEALNITEPVIAVIRQNLLDLLAADKSQPSYFMDALKASGEDNNAKLVAAYFNKEGLKAVYVSPKEAGLLVSDEPGQANVLSESYEKMNQLTNYEEIIVFPGFFGYTKTGKVVTFSRGGSDITGAIVAKSVRALMYENFTDVDGIRVANPNIVPNAKQLKYLTYREMRELSYAGFSVFHDEALEPAFSVGIPVNVKNTNNPDTPGTLITKSTPRPEDTVSGISSMSGFSSIYIEKYLMNKQVGFTRRVLQILEEENISYEHMPSGIDDITILVQPEQLTREKSAVLLQRLRYELKTDHVYFKDTMCLVMLVGEGMVDSIGTLARATKALSQAGINIRMVNQGSSEISMMFGISPIDEKKAVKALYQEFFLTTEKDQA